MWGNRAVLGAALALMAAPAAASAEPQWFSAETISPPGYADPDAVVDPLGNAAVAYAGTAVAVTYRPVGGRFAPPVAVSRPGGGLPRVGIGALGHVEVAWRMAERSHPESDYDIYLESASRRPDGTFSRPERITMPDERASNWFDLATGPDDTTAIAWPRDQASAYAVRVKEPGGEFGSIEEVPRSDDIHPGVPRLQVDATGRVFLFWEEYQDDAGKAIWFAERPPGGNFGTPQQIVTTSDYMALLGADVSPGGTIGVVWSHSDRWPGTDYHTGLAIRPAGSETFSFSPPFPPGGGEPGINQVSEQVAVNDSGEAVVALKVAAGDGKSRVKTTIRAADGQILPSETPSDPSPAKGAPLPGIAENGNALVLWPQIGPEHAEGFDPWTPPWIADPLTHLEASSRPSGGSFGAAGRVSGLGAGVSTLAVSGGGPAVAAWEDSSTGDEENTRCVKAAVRVEVAAPLDGRTCTTIAEPEPIAGPTPDPDSSAPELRIAGRKTVKLGRSMAVLASCDEACALVAGGTLSTKRPRRKAKRVKASAKFRLKGTRTKLTPARRRQRLTLKLSRRSYLKVRRALRRGYRASVAVKIVARDGRGNTKAFRRTLLVKRKR